MKVIFPLFKLYGNWKLCYKGAHFLSIKFHKTFCSLHFKILKYFEQFCTQKNHGKNGGMEDLIFFTLKKTITILHISTINAVVLIKEILVQ
jgi:hypothetical protein